MTGTKHNPWFALAALGLVVTACGTVEAKQGTKAIPQANSVACSVARQDMQRAVDAYTMLEQKPPADEAAMVPNYLLTPSQLMDIDANGKVVAAPGSGCP